MAPPRAGTSELKGSAPAGADQLIWETCWGRRVRVTETVTVTQREKLKGVTETCETRHEVTTTGVKCTETREMGTIEERLHGKDGVEDEHTHTEVVEDNGGELAERVGTRCGQRGSLLRDRRETVCSLEAEHDQLGSVVPSGVEGASAASGCMRSLGGMEAPGTLVVTRIPSVIVPVCVCSRVWQNACCNARIAGVKGVVRERPRV